MIPSNPSTLLTTMMLLILYERYHNQQQWNHKQSKPSPAMSWSDCTSKPLNASTNSTRRLFLFLALGLHISGFPRLNPSEGERRYHQLWVWPRSMVIATMVIGQWIFAVLRWRSCGILGFAGLVSTHPGDVDPSLAWEIVVLPWYLQFWEWDYGRKSWGLNSKKRWMLRSRYQEPVESDHSFLQRFWVSRKNK